MTTSQCTPTRHSVNFELTETQIARFWSYVDKSDSNGCWVWTKSRTTHGGYGQLNIKHRILKAHRLAYRLVHGHLPDNLMVCHHCDNPPCVRPDHLFLGTTQDNTQDMVAKNRHYKIAPRPGELSPRALLTWAQVKLIRDLYRNGERQSDISRRFGVSKQVVWGIIHEHTWREQSE